VSQDQDRILDHEYDGIREYDNRLPNWWLAILYGTVVFGFFYWMYFQSLGIGPTPQERYQMAMIAATEAQLARSEGQELTDETLHMMSTVPERVAEGKAIFDQFCVVCHGNQGQGIVGPNLTDNYWLHGSRPTEIYHTIHDGVIEKGMAAWGNQLGPRRVRAVASYVLTLKGTNVPGKEPQGDPVIAEAEAEEP
jgi:cytochrome c oxidase cbb3-type subunit 3